VKIILATIIVSLFCPLGVRAQDQPQAPAAAVAPSQQGNTQPASPPVVASPQAETKPEATAATPPESQAADAMPRKYVEYWNTGNLDVLKSFYSPMFMTSHGHRVPVGEDLLRTVIGTWRRAMPDLNFKIQDTIIQGDKVAMRLTFTGTYKALLFARTIPPAKTGPPKVIHGTEMLFFQLKNGKIVDIWEEYDELVMRAQMGGTWVVPPPEAEPASPPATGSTPPAAETTPPAAEATPSAPKP
jgi:predicted ester cyclase